MRCFRSVALVAASAATACAMLAAAAGPAQFAQAAVGAQRGAASSSWGTAQVIRGPGGTVGAIWAMSCAGPGDCSAGGDYSGSGGEEAFVVSETNGHWGKAEEVPNIAALNTGGLAILGAISCTSAGNCSAGGIYSVSSTSDNQTFVVTQKNGTWGKAEEVPGTAKLNAGDTGGVNTVSCGSAGNCSAGGIYLDASGDLQAFVVSQSGGTWGKAVEAPGTATLNTGGNASLISVSCRAAGSCTAVGNYSDQPGSGEDQAFVLTQAHGTWGRAEELPGIGTLSGDGMSSMQSVSCGSAGNCSAIGTEWNGTTNVDQAFVAKQASGTWGKPQIVPGITALPGEQGSFAGPEDCYDGNCIAISCPSAGNCTATGSYLNGTSTQAFAVTQTKGTWGKAVAMPGLASLNVGGDAEVYAVSCGAAGDCSAGGYYKSSKTASGPQQAFVITQADGTWGKAIEVPGTAKLDTADFGYVYALSCGSASDCVAGGLYDGTPSAGAFVVARPASQTASPRAVSGLGAPVPDASRGIRALVRLPAVRAATRPPWPGR